ncbi:arsenite methyltransferase [Microbispora triticiradicis]|uniref:arsenite methyltransferase n=1 Tax=Microbispora triticiradicis TaxID=2200763 RepID=UPI001AD6343B|nr:arsenite methyltransferase [Microbispora triticiradicis]MBO4269965.1 GNAT family N-acetyltransferase [Microbispora triticiradicis]
MAHEEIVDRYSRLARTAMSGQSVTGRDSAAFDEASSSEGCFGAADYDDTAALPDGALRASLGCGNPVAVADLHEGDVVLDLGSGGGIDVLLSARRVGPTGKVYGLDASPDMLSLARDNAAQAGVTNTEFLHGTIEHVPLPGRTVDVVISNCVINLSDDKAATLAEAFRVLRPGGRFGVSDVVTEDSVPDQDLRRRTETRIGCTAGSLTAGEYRTLLLDAGFTGITVTPTADHGDGVHSAIVKAVKPPVAPGFEIRPMRAEDADQVLRVYQLGLDTGHASFETTAPSWETFNSARLGNLRYVVADTRTDQVVAWVAASRVSARPVYAGVIEHSIYVHPGYGSRGLGRALLNAFVTASEDAGIWTIQSGVFPENTASLALHRAAGFRVLGTRERIGRHHGVWRDVLMIERRSPAEQLR